MRLGLVLAKGREAEMARLAEDHGLFGVLAGSTNGAVYASTATDFVRIVTSVRLGEEHPVTIAEELSILDNVNNGRTVLVVDRGTLSEEDARDELEVLLEALGNRPLSHHGPRWTVPAGLPANAQAPKAIAVTPKPSQLEIPFWLTSRFAPGLPVVARDFESDLSQASVQPGVVTIAGELKGDRELVIKWAEAGATHVLIELPAGADEKATLTMISRYLAPEVAMPHFPRVMSNSKVPLRWPGDGRS